MRRAIVAAALGSAGLLLALPLAPVAHAGGALEAYDARGVGRGVEVTFAIKPNLLDPIVFLGVPLVRTAMSSAGQGKSLALASQAFPGDLVNSTGGVPGTVRSDFPPGGEKTTGARIPPEGDSPLTMDAGRAVAEAKRTEVRAFVVGHGVAIGADATQPTVAIEEIRVASVGLQDATTVTQVTASKVSRISLAGGMIAIEDLVSVARASSDGALGRADATMTLGEVTVDAGDGQRRRATIDNTGIHVEDPSLPPGVEQRLDQNVQAALAQAGVTVFTTSPTTLVDGPSGTASVGGLVLALSTGRPPGLPLPPLPISPPDVPSNCDTGLCIGPGYLPIPPGDIVATLSLGNATAIATGTSAPTLFGGPPATSVSAFGEPTFGGETGGQTFGGTVVEGAQFAAPPASGSAAAPAAPRRRASLIASVSEMPAAPVLGIGLALLGVALGVLVSPAFRRR